MGTLTVNYEFNLPTIGGDVNVWGSLLNDNWVTLDLLLKTKFDELDAATLSISNILTLLAEFGGTVSLWSGTEESIPDGWFLCNGSNGTPDLRSRFVVGAGTGGGYVAGNTGGAATVALTSAQNGPHTHQVVGNTASDGVHSHGGNIFRSGIGFIVDTLAGAIHSTGDTDSAGAHTHSINITSQSSGSGSAHENRPPYYALCYIMRGPAA